MGLSKEVPFFFALYGNRALSVCGHSDESQNPENSRFPAVSGIITVSNLRGAAVKNYTAEQLKTLSKDELIEALLKQQMAYNVLLERLTASNVNTFGRKSERMEYEGQESLFNEVEAVLDEQLSEPVIEEITYKRRKQSGKREQDLSGFPTTIVNHELSEEELTELFGENGWKRLPDQIYKKLEMHPAQYEVLEHHVAVYASKTDDRIVKAPHPAELLNNSIATASLVAAVMNAKYTNAMPLYRIEQEFERSDVTISRQVMANWVNRCSELYLSLLYDRMHQELLKERVVQADETSVKVSKDGRPAGSESRMWVYRSGEYNTKTPVILYDYQKTRNGDHAIQFLKGFTGYLECDGFSGYRKLDRLVDEISIACCWAHARRNFADAVKAYGEKSKGVQETLAYRALEKISRIYLLDEKFKNLPPEERMKRRQTTVKPRVDAFFAWVKERQADVPQKGKTGEGFTYCLNAEKYLRVFLDDGLVPIDNSASERAIRPFAVGRKNWQLIDTVNGAQASAIIYSIVETAKANNLKPYEYLRHLLTELPRRLDEKSSDLKLDDLLPWSDDLPDTCRKKKDK